MVLRLLWDHPRLRGEYFELSLIVPSKVGSPPLARGIQGFAFRNAFETRITPACAGNTTACYSLRMLWKDHPRLRGEYSKNIILIKTEVGSPPLARGIQHNKRPIYGDTGITPACAGNTNALIASRISFEDHPRLRGEYCTSLQAGRFIKGSPPLARGILTGILVVSATVGITPACAGNTYIISCRVK